MCTEDYAVPMPVDILTANPAYNLFHFTHKVEMEYRPNT